MLRMDKNQLLLRLLADDARNLLANQQPFRLKLLQARYKDPNWG